MNNLQEDALHFWGYSTLLLVHTVAGTYGRGVLDLMASRMQKKGNKQKKDHRQNTTKYLFHSPTL